MSTRHALVETRHGLISTSDLDLEKGSLVTVAATVGTLDTTLLRIIPRSGSSKDVLLLDTFVDSTGKHGLGDVVLEWTGSAFETVRSRVCQGDGEDVGAMGAEE